MRKYRHSLLAKAPFIQGPLLAALLLVGAIIPASVRGQGCVAARGAGLPCNISGMHGDMGAAHATMTGWQASVGYRWLQSDRHFTGDHEDTNRETEGSQVINRSSFMDLSITYTFNPRYSATLTLPFVYNDRSQTVRSNDTARTILERFDTHAAGLGDIRLGANMWLLDPVKPRKHNVLLGVTVDAPTGKKNSKDDFRVFRNPNVVTEERTVDQSIQPGDGGWGITLDLYAYQQIVPRLNAYVNGSYSITPQEKNGVPTFRNNINESIMSIADAYMGRTGLEYMMWPKHALTLSLGGRIEGAPVNDLVGGSEGFRRPGFAISIEPGITATVNSWSFSLYTPVAMYRNRERSKPDKMTSATAHGDAAFADYLVMFNVAKRF